MISVFIGLPGAGKSYSATVLLVESLLKGRRVVTSLPVNEVALREYLSDAYDKRLQQKRKKRKRSLLHRLKLQFFLFKRAGVPRFGRPDLLKNLLVCDPADLFSVSAWQSAVDWGVENVKDRQSGSGVVLIIDEVGSVLDSIVGAGTEKQVQWLKLMREHRHYCASIIFLCQSHHQLDTVHGLKSLVQEWVELANLRYGTGIKAYERISYTSHYGKREPLSTKRGRYLTEIFKLYSSHSLGSSEHDMSNIGVENEVTIGGNSHWKLYFFVALFLLGIGLFLYKSSEFYERIAGWVGGSSSETSIIDNQDPAIAIAELPDQHISLNEKHQKLMKQYPDLKFRKIKAFGGQLFIEHGAINKINSNECRLILLDNTSYIACSDK